jgi:hypothetical protein
MVGLGRELGDVVDYVRDNDLGTAALLAAVARHRRDFVHVTDVARANWPP